MEQLRQSAAGAAEVAGKGLRFGIGSSYLKDGPQSLEDTHKGSPPEGYVRSPVSKYKCPGGGMVDTSA